MGSLLRLAAPREIVPIERAMRVKAAVRASWHQKVKARSRRVTTVWLLGAVTAAALVVFGAHFTVRQDERVGTPHPVVATAETVSGSVRIVSALQADSITSLQLGHRIRAGSTLDTTSGGRAALRLAGGIAVRVDSGTRVHVASEASLFLEHGRIYVDSEGSRVTAPFEIRTDLGVARDIGTRFKVSVSSSALRVRVRDGIVQLLHRGQSHDATRGEELTLHDNGNMVRRTVAVYGPDWAWAVALAGAFELEGRSLSAFLTWVCEENGWELSFADAVAQREADTAILHGSIEGLTPEEALPAVLLTTGMEHELNDGILIVQRNSNERNNGA